MDSLRTRIALLLLVTGLLPLLVTSWLLYQQSVENITHSTLARMDSLADAQARRINALVERDFERLALVASRTQLRIRLAHFNQGQDRAGAVAQMSKILRDAHASIHAAPTFTIVGADGAPIASSGKTVATRPVIPVSIESAPLDLSKRGLAVTPLTHGRAQLLVFAPLMLDGAPIGRLVMTSSVEPLDRVINSYDGLGATGETLLAERKENGDARFITPTRFDADARLKRTVASTEHDVPMTQALLRREMLLRDAVDYLGNPVLAATRYIPAVDWGVVVKMHHSEAFADTHEMRNLAGLSLGVSAVVILILASIAHKSVVVPLTLLAQAARRIADGRWSARVEVISSAEIGTLQRSFNRMANEVQGSHDEIAARVAELEIVAKELRRSNADLDDFAYIASHDLKEPLRGIHNYSSFLIEDYNDVLPADGQDKLATLMRLTTRLERLIDALLYYSRVGRQELELQQADIHEIVQGVLDSLTPSLEEHQVEIRIPSHLPSVVCDSARVAEIFRNLISNALKYNDKPEQWIEIGSDTDASGQRTFYVADNGVGIRAKHLKSVFKIFKRLHGRNKFGGGEGAGLSIVKTMVERHGGTIWVTSEHGVGSRFEFTLESDSAWSKMAEASSS